MKKLKIFGLVLLTATFLATSCASSNNGIKGSAVDRTGTNGATNGTGKIPKNL